MKFKTCISVLLFLVSFEQKAQNPSNRFNDKCKVSVLANRSVQIEFAVDKNVRNVLVLLVDGSGNTVFLDSQYNFKGIYKRTIDLSKSPKGNYYLKIMNDDEVMNKKLDIE
jgi:hypothetical protein